MALISIMISVNMVTIIIQFCSSLRSKSSKESKEEKNEKIAQKNKTPFKKWGNRRRRDQRQQQDQAQAKPRTKHLKDLPSNLGRDKSSSNKGVERFHGVNKGHGLPGLRGFNQNPTRNQISIPYLVRPPKVKVSHKKQIRLSKDDDQDQISIRFG